MFGEARYKVCVMMSTYNGEKYLEQQIDSIIKQENAVIRLVIRDDGSIDNTEKILSKYETEYSGIINIIKDDKVNHGVNYSFFYLLNTLDMKVLEEYEYFAFSDQDDIWLNNKMVNACRKLEGIETPSLYFSSKNIVNEKMERIYSDFNNYTGRFEDILCDANAYGCTMVLNRKFINVLKSKQVYDCPSFYDAYIYRYAIINGYRVFYDKGSQILYRQHASNSVGFKRKNENLLRMLSKGNLLFSRRDHFYQNIVRLILDKSNSLDIPELNLYKCRLILEYDKRLVSKIKVMYLYLRDSKASYRWKLKTELRFLFNMI